METKQRYLDFHSGAMLVLSAAVIGFVYSSPLKRLINFEWSRADFDYCYLIPVAVAYLIWEKREEFFSLKSKPSWWGLIPILFAVFFFLLGILGGEFLSLYISLWFSILGLCWVQFGWQKLKSILFPICFLLTAFPPPNFFYSRLTLNMQLISSQIGEKFLHLLGVSAYRTGNVIDLGFTQMQVVDACSGLRFLIPMLIVAILLVYLFKDKWWKRALVLGSAIPLAVGLNGLRIGLLGYLAKVIDPSITSGTVHDLTGWVMFFVGTGTMFAMLYLLGKLGREESAETEKKVSEQDSLNKKSGFSLPFVMALLCIIGTFAFISYKEKVDNVLPQAKELGDFPKQLGPWTGQSFKMSQDIIDELDLTDYLQMNFTGPQGQEVEFYVAWYNSQSRGEAIHSPETCLRGGGWKFVSSGETEVNISGYEGSPLRVNRTVLRQKEGRMLSYFWFPVRGRNLINAYELKLATFWGALTRNRTDGALVRVMTTLEEGESMYKAESRIKDFLSRSLPVLDNYLPE